MKFLGEPQTQVREEELVERHAVQQRALRGAHAGLREYRDAAWSCTSSSGSTDEALIGELPARWNHLVGYDAPRADAALVHYTLGGP